MNTSSPATGTEFPVMGNVSVAQGSFRQKIIVGNGQPFDDDQLNLFQSLYAGYTVHFAVTDADIGNGEITTSCTVNQMEEIVNTTSITNATLEENGVRKLRSSFQSVQRHVREEDFLPIEGLFIDYTMSFESQYDDVSHYDLLFQNWINNNLNFVAEGLLTLNFNVTAVETASKLLESSPTAAPTVSTTETALLTNEPSESPSSSPPSPNTKNSNGIAIILSSLFLGICIVVAGLLVYWKKHRSVGSQKKDKERQSTKEMNSDDIEKAATDHDKKVRILEPTPSSSSSSSVKDGDHNNSVGKVGMKVETPTSGEHYDDWVHHYYKKKNENKDRKKKESSSKSRSSTKPSRHSESSPSGTVGKRDESIDRHNRSARESAKPPVDLYRSSGARSSNSSMEASLQKLEEQRPFLSEEEYEDLRREILLAALQ
ncbi:hypothetical protein IV203_007238 [Nitzschia inconspicua]|uniref:Uncharacterized protein n=1 Tax=Nitzschia inconspicua TaxID=303405 RepID=A0A9K3PD05_9STRA|nr:hypothetical protein IV203_007238 [Nitzschia inconspicua]